MFVQKNKKILFLGTPKIAAEMLSALIENGANVVGAVTQPDRQKDRKQNLIPTPVKEVALANNLPVFQPVKVREIREQITEIKPDLVIVCAYGEIVGEWLLKLPKYKCVNIHVSLLPKLRGAAPINYAIFEDLKETGVTLMYMNKGMDTGDIIKQKAIPVAPTETFSSLYDKLTNLGKELIVEMFDELFDENLPHFQQDNELATYCSKIVEEKIS
jgi:methionyl-tRNA formyltransferase